MSSAPIDYDRDYARLKGPIERRFRRRFPTLRGHESDAYSAAWEWVLRHEGEIDSLERYLERAAHSYGLMELRRRRRKPAASLDAPASADAPPLVELLSERGAESVEERAELREEVREVDEAVLSALTERQRRCVKLQWGWGLSREEVAPVLAITPRMVKREMKEAQARLLRETEIFDPCQDGETRRSLVTAYAVGVLSDRRARQAEIHLARCDPCRAIHDEVRARMRGLAALVPAALLASPADLGEGPFARIVEHATEAFTQAKQQAAALVARTPVGDAGAQAAAGGGLRGSGAMLATAASCLVVVGGGTVTYCAVEGVPDPVRSALGQSDARAEGQAGRGGAEAPPDQPTVPSEPVAVSAAPEPRPTQAPDAESARREERPAEPRPSPVEEEFGVQGGPPPQEPTASAAQQSPPPPSSEPSRSPGAGGQEFGFEG